MVVFKYVAIPLCACMSIGLIIYLIKDIHKCTRIYNEFGELIKRCEEAAKQSEKEQLERKKKS